MPDIGNQELRHEIDEFLVDRQARNCTPSTLDYYRRCTAAWRDFCVTKGITCTLDVTPSHVRRFLVHLADKGHSPGGVATLYTGVRAFLRWYRAEYAPEGWDPLARIQAPKRPQELLKPLSLADFQAMLATCPRRTFFGDRDRALLLVLLDTGVRHQELADLTVGDVDLSTGLVVVQQGKGRKRRAVFIGSTTKRALLAYYRHRDNLQGDVPLWVKQNGERLSKAGIRQVVRRAAQQAGLTEPGMHAFRRAFAINALRNGMDVVTLQRLLGHADLSVVNRYLALVEDDLRQAHSKYGVVDNIKRRGGQNR